MTAVATAIATTMTTTTTPTTTDTKWCGQGPISTLTHQRSHAICTNLHYTKQIITAAIAAAATMTTTTTMDTAMPMLRLQQLQYYDCYY